MHLDAAQYSWVLRCINQFFGTVISFPDSGTERFNNLLAYCRLTHERINILRDLRDKTQNERQPTRNYCPNQIASSRAQPLCTRGSAIRIAPKLEFDLPNGPSCYPSAETR